MTLVPRLQMSGAIPPLPLNALMAGHLYILLDQSSEEEKQ
jgi:hypothetical protein